jgi:carbon storage regulator CsrA
MLVLSRRTNEKIIFPTINTIVQVVSMKSGTVRLGIQAPTHVPVYREEVLDRYTREDLERRIREGGGKATTPANEKQDALDPELLQLIHTANNRLNCTTIGVALLRRQLDLGMTREMATTLSRIEQELSALKTNFAEISTPTAKRPCRALLVEDDVNECELLAGFLRLAGLQVLTAGDGADALSKLDKVGKPDVVVVDMLLPRVDGPSTVRAIRSNPDNAGLKIIGITGADPQRFGLPDGPNGINRWFPKPLNPEALLAELQTAVAC